MTAWMYGTHLLVNEEKGERYALESGELSLSKYNHENVIFDGIKVHDGVDTDLVLVKVTGVVVGRDENVVLNEEDGIVTANGTIESLEGKTTEWMYGTHVLKKGKNITYALKDSEGNLEVYNGKEVTLKGFVIHKGVDGSPVYLEVNQVEIIEKNNGSKPSGSLDMRQIYALGGVLGFIIIIGVLTLIFK